MYRTILNNRKSASAFSIIEAIVSMAVTAIIMGILFVIFSIITGQTLDFKNQNQFINDINRLTYSLNKDIFEKEKMTISNNEICFIGYTGSKTTYRFSDESILRNSGMFTDTFQIKLNNIILDTVRSKSEQSVFQKIKLDIKSNNEMPDLRFYKRIYPNELLQTIKKK